MDACRKFSSSYFSKYLKALERASAKLQCSRKQRELKPLTIRLQAIVFKVSCELACIPLKMQSKSTLTLS